VAAAGGPRRRRVPPAARARQRRRLSGQQHRPAPLLRGACSQLFAAQQRPVLRNGAQLQIRLAIIRAPSPRSSVRQQTASYVLVRPLRGIYLVVSQDRKTVFDDGLALMLQLTLPCSTSPCPALYQDSASTAAFVKLQCRALQVDLHGLHVEEALGRLEHQLLCLGGLAADHPEGLTLRVIVGAIPRPRGGYLCIPLPAQRAATNCCVVAAVVCPVQTRRARLALEHRALDLDVAV